MYMKRRTTKKGAPSVRKTAEMVWTRCWKEMPQRKIQEWIERIPRHIQEVIRLGGSNDYKEGRYDPIYGVRPVYGPNVQ